MRPDNGLNKDLLGAKFIKYVSLCLHIIYESCDTLIPGIVQVSGKVTRLTRKSHVIFRYLGSARWKDKSPNFMEYIM